MTYGSTSTSKSKNAGLTLLISRLSVENKLQLC
jgi:hypothetical protein